MAPDIVATEGDRSTPAAELAESVAKDWVWSPSWIFQLDVLIMVQEYFILFNLVQIIREIKRAEQQFTQIPCNFKKCIRPDRSPATMIRSSFTVQAVTSLSPVNVVSKVPSAIFQTFTVQSFEAEMA